MIHFSSRPTMGGSLRLPLTPVEFATEAAMELDVTDSPLACLGMPNQPNSRWLRVQSAKVKNKV